MLSDQHAVGQVDLHVGHRDGGGDLLKGDVVETRQVMDGCSTPPPTVPPIGTRHGYTDGQVYLERRFLDGFAGSASGGPGRRSRTPARAVAKADPSFDRDGNAP